MFLYEKLARVTCFSEHFELQILARMRDCRLLQLIVNDFIGELRNACEISGSLLNLVSSTFSHSMIYFLEVNYNLFPTCLLSHASQHHAPSKLS